MPDISVIVPVYNIEKYLSECVESIINQTYKNIEVVLVNDGSTDTSGAICDEYARKDSRVKVYHIENSGPSKARNYGIEKATGTYIMFVDSDDWIDRNTLQACWQMCGKKDVDVVLFNMCDFEGNNVQEYRVLKGEVRHFKGENINYIENMLLTLRGENIGSVTSLTGPVCKLYKTELVKECFFPDKITLGEDTCFVEQIIKKAKHIVYIEDIFYHRRILASSLSHICGENYIQRRVDYVNWTLKFYEKDKEYGLLNEFCFNNYYAVITKLLMDKTISFGKKRKLAKEFLQKLEFNYKPKDITIVCNNKNARIMQEMAKRECILGIDVILRLSKLKKRFKRRL